MSLLLVGALALSLQTAPAELGYELFHFGGCEEAGWALDRTGIAPLVIGRRAESGLSDDDFQTAIADGATRAGTEFEAMTVAIATQADARAFRDVTSNAAMPSARPIPKSSAARPKPKPPGTRGCRASSRAIRNSRRPTCRPRGGRAIDPASAPKGGTGGCVAQR